MRIMPRWQSIRSNGKFFFLSFFVSYCFMLLKWYRIAIPILYHVLFFWMSFTLCCLIFSCIEGSYIPQNDYISIYIIVLRYMSYCIYLIWTIKFREVVGKLPKRFNLLYAKFILIICEIWIGNRVPDYLVMSTGNFKPINLTAPVISTGQIVETRI